MFWYAVTLLLRLLLDVFSGHSHQADKELEILVLKRQVGILERKLGHKPRIKGWEKCVLAVVTVKLMQQTGQRRTQLAGLLMFKPESRAQVASGLGPTQMDVQTTTTGGQTGDEL